MASRVVDRRRWRGWSVRVRSDPGRVVVVRQSRHRVRRTASEAWLWTRVIVTVIVWIAASAIVGLVVALNIPGLR